MVGTMVADDIGLVCRLRMVYIGSVMIHFERVMYSTLQFLSRSKVNDERAAKADSGGAQRPISQAH